MVALSGVWLMPIKLHECPHCGQRRRKGGKFPWMSPAPYLPAHPAICWVCAAKEDLFYSSGMSYEDWHEMLKRAISRTIPDPSIMFSMVGMRVKKAETVEELGMLELKRRVKEAFYWKDYILQLLSSLHTHLKEKKKRKEYRDAADARSQS